MSSLAQQRRVIEQLRRESEIKRINVSTACDDLKVRFKVLILTLTLNTYFIASPTENQKYVEEHQSEDYFLVGFHSQKANPFREKNPCVVF